MHLASYPLLPRPRWPDAVVGPYTLLVSTHPMLSILIYCALDSFVGVGIACCRWLLVCGVSMLRWGYSTFLKAPRSIHRIAIRDTGRSCRSSAPSTVHGGHHSTAYNTKLARVT